MGGARLLPLLLAAACAEPATPTILAAASLHAVLPDLLAGEKVRISHGPTPALARQLEQGHPADLLLSADREWIDRLRSRGLGIEAREIARNALVVWVPEGTPGPASPEALADRRFARIAVGADTVPVGRYAREALAGLGLESRFLPCASSPLVIAVLRAGEADAAVAYATDGAGVSGIAAAFRLERPVPAYWALLCRDRPEARRLLDRISGEGAAAILARHGFTPVR